MHIYLIKEKQTSFSKIGYAGNASDRLKSLQAGNPRKLIIYKYFVIGEKSMTTQERCNKARALEYKCKQALCNFQARREWFYIPYIKDAVEIMEKVIDQKALDHDKEAATVIKSGKLTYIHDGVTFKLKED